MANCHHIISDQPKSTAKMHSLQPPNLPDIGSATCRLGKNKKKKTKLTNPSHPHPFKRKQEFARGRFPNITDFTSQVFQGANLRLGLAISGYILPLMDKSLTSHLRCVFSKCETQMAKNHQPIIELDLEVMNVLPHSETKHLWKKSLINLSTCEKPKLEKGWCFFLEKRNWKDVKGHSSGHMKYYFTNHTNFPEFFCKGSHFPFPKTLPFCFFCFGPSFFGPRWNSSPPPQGLRYKGHDTDHA